MILWVIIIGIRQYLPSGDLDKVVLFKASLSGAECLHLNGSKREGRRTRFGVAESRASESILGYTDDGVCVCDRWGLDRGSERQAEVGGEIVAQYGSNTSDRHSEPSHVPNVSMHGGGACSR